jgi:hypothetical protein
MSDTRGEVKIPDDLRDLFDDCEANDSRTLRFTTTGFLGTLIQRIAALIAERVEEAQLYAQSLRCNDELTKRIANLEHELSQARAAAQAMSRPVSDPEWERLIANSNADEDNEIWETIYRSDVNALIAARVRDSKEADNGKNGR